MNNYEYNLLGVISEINTNDKMKKRYICFIKKNNAWVYLDNNSNYNQQIFSFQYLKNYGKILALFYYDQSRVTYQSMSNININNNMAQTQFSINSMSTSNDSFNANLMNNNMNNNMYINNINPNNNNMKMFDNNINIMNNNQYIIYNNPNPQNNPNMNNNNDYMNNYNNANNFVNNNNINLNNNFGPRMNNNNNINNNNSGNGININNNIINQMNQMNINGYI